MSEAAVICPWCKEGDFDLVGLKDHLNRGYCEVFNDCETVKDLLQMTDETIAERREQEHPHDPS